MESRSAPLCSQELQQLTKSIRVQKQQDSRASQESIPKPTQLSGYHVINKSCSIFADITICYSKIYLCGTKCSYFAKQVAFRWFLRPLPLGSFSFDGFSPRSCTASAPPTLPAFRGNLGNSINQPSHAKLSVLDLSQPQREIMQETKAHLNKTLRGFKTSSVPKDDNNDLCRFNYVMQMWWGACRISTWSGPLFPA